MAGEGRESGYKRPKWKTKQWGKGKEAGILPGLHPAPGTTGVGQQDDPNPSWQWGKAGGIDGTAEDREIVRGSEGTLES